MSRLGILLTNTGTPDAPTPNAVRKYLKEFLTDKRVVKIPRLIWLPILYGIILTIRPKKSAKLYHEIWTNEGSPMRTFMQRIVTKLNLKLNNRDAKIEVVIGMNYGNPSIDAAIKKLLDININEVIVIPLFPQFSDTTTSSSLDKFEAFLAKSSTSINSTVISSYHEHPLYIEALANSVRAQWNKHGKSQKLLISFHGIPKRFIEAGDSYQSQCEITANLLAKELALEPQDWILCYQSKFGYDKWLQPSTQQLFLELPTSGIRSIDVICPGFSVDCLETLEEINISGRKSYLESGGNTFNYISALNDNEDQLALLENIIVDNLNNDSRIKR